MVQLKAPGSCVFACHVPVLLSVLPNLKALLQLRSLLANAIVKQSAHARGSRRRNQERPSTQSLAQFGGDADPQLLTGKRLDSDQSGFQSKASNPQNPKQPANEGPVTSPGKLLMGHSAHAR